MLFTPPESFGVVERGIYRSNTLHPLNFPFVKNLNLRTAVMLSPEVPMRSVTNFFEDSGIRFVHLGQAWKPNLEELMKEGLELILDKKNQPVMVMCTSGVHETGTLMGCLRKLQGWNFNSIVVEYHSFAGSKARFVNEQFIELFDLDLVTFPLDLPNWFLFHQELLEEEEAFALSRLT
ncbi:protein-tyrosine phosphatase [Gonapodya prolifera JEL478]|uniref:Protein-tyrosine phosphatase n=1 Tax=Gonapodya prolifera (strain JEL478) TaxID=1344416 RepID=A0A138ZXW1_GONPJ|nr:protein-tyrosine phosphatase [Gonapodya prolifera JEL478]|eukprot:KXS09319.1 protein-tyrosine phosphatase [Gonapodya prolifera JEL478]